jgi:peptidoglycan/xylan/chitin deacetylase (PgdA/CDA1 family)
MDLRLDRLATLYIATPLMRIALKREPAIPILMYHGIAEQDESGKHPYFRTSTSPAVFGAQIEYLHVHGYRTCSVGQAIAFLEADSPEAGKYVVLTFDDGYRDFYANAFPVLNQYGFTATVYLPTAFIGDRMMQFKGRDCLTWSEVRELQAHGIEFGSHTVTHAQLHDLDAKSIDAEISNSKATIEGKTGSRVDSFAYPYAFPQTDQEFTRRLRGFLETAGYTEGVCTVIGRARRDGGRFFIERLPINSLDDRALLKAKLDGAYDWMARPQASFKAFKNGANRSTMRGDA